MESLLVEKDDPKAHAFIESFHVEGPPETLEELKKKFMIFYTGKVYLGSQLPRLASIAMGKEKPGDYCSRIAMVCTGSGIDIGERSTKMRQYLETWFANLPSQEQNNLQGDFSRLPKDASVQDYLNLIIQLIPQEPGYIRKQNIHCPYCSGLVQWDCSECTTGVLLSKKDKGLKRSTDDTSGSTTKRFKRDRAAATYKERGVDRKHNQQKDQEEINKLKAEGKCFKCKESWSPNHKCTPAIGSNAAIVDDSIMDTEYWNEALENAVDQQWNQDSEGDAFAGMVDSRGEKIVIDFDSIRPKVDLFLNGNCAKRLNLDTGSDLTLITKAAITRIFGGKDWKKNLKRTERRIHSASMEAVRSLGDIVLDVQRQEGGTVFKHTFVVVKALPLQVQALIGLDLQLKLGFKLIEEAPASVNLVTTGEEPGMKTLNETMSMVESLLALQECNKSDEKYMVYLGAYRRNLWLDIAKLKAINENLKGFCTYPGAEIRFETTDEDPVVVPQYPIAIVHHDAIQKQIDEWDLLGVVSEETGLDHYNNPILVVPKRDVSGRIKSWRVCVDPRIRSKIPLTSFL